MGIHSLSEINEGKRTAICSECGPVPIRKGSPGKHAKWRCKPGERRYPKKTKSESAEMKRRKKRRSFKKDCCERCGFIPEHPTQLDIHHKDEDKDNEDPANYETLCANCHRLVSAIARGEVAA